MILWNVRHAGSPESLDGLSAEDVIDGIKEGVWDPSDEIMGPNDPDWQTIEEHPVFAKAMEDYEPPPPKFHPDETKLDMNPLIDVALVLLIFFMLTTTYEELRKEFDPPPGEREDKQGVISDPELSKQSVRVWAKMEDGQAVYYVEEAKVAANELEAKFKEYRESKGVDKLAMEVEPSVPWKAVVAIQDAAAGAKFQEIIRVVRSPRE
jgi:biopolymer transport protein ExbD